MQGTSFGDALHILDAGELVNMLLRKGKTKAILEASIDSALLAVEVYNKPRSTFRSEAYITLMVISWTRLLHAHFHNTIGDKYYYKDKKNPKRYALVDGEKKAWELSECIKQFKTLSEATKKNLEFFIKLRNKIEHRHIDAREVDVSIFGECQSMLFNFENTLIGLFGSDYAINEALVYSLQFSHLRTSAQHIAGQSVLSKDTSDILSYITKYRYSMTSEIYDSQEYSIKLLQIPRISNNDRNVPAIEFVKWSELNEDDRNAYEKISALIKDKKVYVEAANIKRLKPGKVKEKVLESIQGFKFTDHTHTSLWKIFGVRPHNDSDDPFDTNNEYCFYDETHKDYVYEHAWVDFIVHILQSEKMTIEDIHKNAKANIKLNVKDFKQLI